MTPTHPTPAPRGGAARLAATVVAVLTATVALLVGPPAASADDDVRLDPVQVADTSPVEPGIVRIDTRLSVQQAVGAGTGIVLSPDGIVLTNNHVIRGADDIAVTSVGNGQRYAVDVLGYDRKSDVAVLRLRGAEGLPVAPIGDASRVRIGDPVTALGFAGGGDLARAPGRVRDLSQNVVAEDDVTGSSERLDGLLGVDANIRPGDSGGPLVDGANQVVGIVTVGSSTYRMTSAGGGAIPIGRAIAIADAVRAGNESGSVHVGPTGILGVAVTNARGGDGVTVRNVLRDSGADTAGIPSGARITAVDSVRIADGTALTDVLDAHHPGDVVSLDYADPSGAPRTTRVTLTEGPPN